MTLCFMDKSPDGTVRDSSKVIKSNVFYVLEYRELVLTLLLTFDEMKMSDQYLKDLMETQHIFLKSFEAFCKDGAVIVQTRNKSKKKKKKGGLRKVFFKGLTHTLLGGCSFKLQKTKDAPTSDECFPNLQRSSIRSPNVF